MSIKSVIVDFVKNLKTRDELKTLFINNYNNSRGSTIDTVGIALNNTNNTICYFISAFNIISRLQYVIFNEINKLSDLSEIVTKLTEDKCLEEEESKKFNKYLLIQTIIEVHTAEITDKIEFIHERLKQFTFSKNSFDLNEPLMNKVQNEIGNIRTQLLNVWYILNSEDNMNLMSLVDKLYKTNEINISAAYATGETENLYKNFFEESISKIIEIKEKFLKNYSKWMTDGKLNLENIKTDFNEFDEINDATDLLDNLTTLHSSFNIIDDLTRKYTDKDIVMDELCANTLLKNNMLNKEFLRTYFAVTIDGKEPNGSMSSITIRALLDCLDTPDVVIMSDNSSFESIKTNIKEQSVPYVIYNYDNLKNLLDNDFVNLKNNEDNLYNLVTISYNCGNKHSVASTCYGKECLDFKHILINENKKFEVDLKNFNSGSKGNHCIAEKMSLENITFELNSYVKKLLNDIQIYSTTNGLTMPNIHGGGDRFKLKYLKYKNKYLMLKK